MRSASWGVVIDPSTRDRSYGPLTTARDASGKCAISTSPATASNSSSQSNRLNWQPSQDANFQTASFGLRSILDLPLEEQVLHATIGKHGSIFANKVWAILAVPAEAERTFHVAFHRDKDVLRSYP